MKNASLCERMTKQSKRYEELTGSTIELPPTAPNLEILRGLVTALETVKEAEDGQRNSSS